MREITAILSAVQHGQPQAAEELLPIIYDQLRHLAAHRLSHEPPGQTLLAPSLVHEDWLRLVGAERQGVGTAKTFLCGGGRGDAPHPDRERPAQAAAKTRRRLGAS